MPEAPAALAAALADRYGLERKLGEGGMASVYLADDLKHQRKVALKVLRPELAAILGAERFLAEIRTTANLQHPHILPLHDSGQVESTVFYVMPYVEGESLRDRLAREKQLPVDEAVKLASQVASALDYAHRHGVIHRDIKPENILLHDGQALVADFGIALAASSTGGTRMTETGMSLGTPHYMSPEQAMGEREITARSDVYALGVVTYEMLTGDPPFTGSTAQAIVARVVTEDPRPITLQRKTVPPHVEEAVLTALSKLPADRFASAAEFAQALAGQGPVGSTRRAAALGSTGAGGTRLRRLVAVLGTLLALASAGLAWVLLRPRPAAPVIRNAIEFPPEQTPRAGSPLVLSPDGSRLIFGAPSTTTPERVQLWVKRRENHLATPLPGTETPGAFAISPDGRWLTLTLGRQLRRIPVDGGPPEMISDTIAPAGGHGWTDDGQIVYASADGELAAIPATGGVPTTLYRAERGITLLLPRAVPGSRWLLFTRCTGSFCRGGMEVWLLDRRSGQARALIPDAALALPLATGHLLAVRRDGNGVAVPFDADKGVVTGPPVPLLEGIALRDGVVPLIDVSASGVLAMRSGTLAQSGRVEMVWVDRSGAVAPVEPGWEVDMRVTGNNRGWALSPDGNRLALTLRTEAGDDIWIKQLPHGPLSRLTFESGPEMRPRWSSDGQRVTYIFADSGTSYDLFEQHADGTGERRLLADLPGRINEGGWVDGGRWLLLRTGGESGAGGNLAGGRDILGLRPGQDSAPVPLVATATFDEEAPAVSPDGKWIAYESNETGRIEVYVRPFPATNAGKWQVSTEGGQSPVWSRSSRELFYINGNRAMMAVAVRPVAPPLGATTRLFTAAPELRLDPLEYYALFDVSPDGKRFLMVRQVATTDEEVPPLIVVENWLEEVRQKVRGQ